MKSSSETSTQSLEATTSKANHLTRSRSAHDDDDDEETVIYNRIKANIFFLLGSTAVLPPTIAEVVVINRTTPMPDEEEEATIVMEPPPPSTYLWYQMCIGGFLLSYLFNGLFETWIAYQAYKKAKHAAIYRRAVLSAAAISIEDEKQVGEGSGSSPSEASSSFLTEAEGAAAQVVQDGPPYRGDIINGIIFTTAATLAILSTVPALSEHIMLTTSACFYLVNGLVTLILRGMESKDTSPLSFSDHLVRIGDLLFLLGSILDLWVAQQSILMTISDTVYFQRLIASLALCSAILWFADAILYLVADHFLLFNNKNKSNSNQHVGSRGTNNNENQNQTATYIELLPPKEKEEDKLDKHDDDHHQTDVKLSSNL